MLNINGREFIRPAILEHIRGAVDGLLLEAGLQLHNLAGLQLFHSPVGDR